MQTPQNASEQEMSLPLGLRYGLGVNDTVSSSRNLAQYLASNSGVFSGAGTNVARIPIASGNFLDLKNALVQFDFTNKGDGDCNLDGSAACVIEQISVIAGGQTIETIRHYNQLDAVLDQYSTSTGAMHVHHALKGGVARIDDTPRFNVVAPGEVTTGAIATLTQPTSGLIFKAEQTVTAGITSEYSLEGLGGIGYDQTQTAVIGANKKQKFTFGLRGLGFFNPTTNKLLPPSTPFMLEIQFAPSANCLVVPAGKTCDYTVENIEIHIPEIRINDATFMSRIQSRMASPMAWKCNSYDHFVNTMQAGDGATTIQLSARARSLKGLMTIIRKQAHVTNKLRYKLSKRTIQYVDEFSYRLGSTSYPNQPVHFATDLTGNTGSAAGTRLPVSAVSLDIGEPFSQAMRLFGNLNTPNANCLLSQESFGQSEENNGAGILAMDFSAYNDGSVNSGVNTLNNLPVSLELRRTTANSVGTKQVDTYSIHELVIVRDGGGQLSSMY